MKNLNVVTDCCITELVQPALIQSEPMSEADLQKLIEPQEAYGRWVRLVVLRILMAPSAWSALMQPNNSFIAQIGFVLGLPAFEELFKRKEGVSARTVLANLLAIWEREAPPGPVFPAQLAANLDSLSTKITLTENEKTILGFMVLIHAESVIEDACWLLGERVGGFAVPRMLATALGIDVSEVERALDQQGTLNRSGLASIDYQHEGSLRSRIDLITNAFAKKMVVRQASILDLFNDFVTVSTECRLKVTDYGHVQDRLDLIQSYLRSVMQTGASGVNILIYGKPGTGKSQFARVLARELACDLIQITDMTCHGAPITPQRRLRNFRLAQVFFKKSQSIVLFDECEEVLSGEGPAKPANGGSPTAQKSWINQTLENNQLPTIWIANSITDFDPAFIRRFCICFEMPMPVERERRKMVSTMFEQPIEGRLLKKIVANEHLVPALLEQTARIVNVIGKNESEAARNKLAMQLLNDKLKAQGRQRIELGNAVHFDSQFDPALVNCSVNLKGLRDGISEAGQGRFCLYGPPGTGKTAFGKWIAETLEIPHILRKGSDILAPHLGETEKNIANAFAEARQARALLQFDEVDSFLQDRNDATRHWETSMVNEMLTQMEGFEGVFIASTNRFDHLDEASLRRFDLSIKFDFLATQSSWLMFTRVCGWFGFAVDEEKMRTELQKLHSLTPGDFEQVSRQGRFLKPASASDILGLLQKASGLKKSVACKPMGFTA